MRTIRVILVACNLYSYPDLTQISSNGERLSLSSTLIWSIGKPVGWGGLK